MSPFISACSADGPVIAKTGNCNITCPIWNLQVMLQKLKNRKCSPFGNWHPLGRRGNYSVKKELSNACMWVHLFYKLPIILLYIFKFSVVKVDLTFWFTCTLWLPTSWGNTSGGKQRAVDCLSHAEKPPTCSDTCPGERMWFRKRTNG